MPLLDFMLFEWLPTEELLPRKRFEQTTRQDLDDLLAAASNIAEKHFEPAARASDVEEPQVGEDGVVRLPAATHEAWKAYSDFGFQAAPHDEAVGGMQIPRVVDMATRVVFAAAGANLVPSMLSDHNASLLLTYGTPAQQREFALPQVESRWTGTMCLSEPQAGSSLADITTRAVPDGDTFDADPLGPRYRVFGSKMWISAAEHDLTPNIVHLVLAKTALADGTTAPGARSISLFVVPKFLTNGDGSMTDRNDVSLVGLNHKLGSRGTPNTALAFGDGSHRPGGQSGAVGYLVGQPGDGLRQMFHMMNASRIEIGLRSAAVGFAGFALSLDYAKERRQGRHATAAGKDASADPVPIVEHSDVRRMLLAQKAYSTAGIAMGLYAGLLLDERSTGDTEAAQRAETLLELLTPVVKSWPSEWCLEANSLAIQVLGGAGYTRDFPAEMYWRDQRLNMIHEGTHGIQAIDLLGRKVLQHDGAALSLLTAKVEDCAGRATTAGMAGQGAALRASWASVLEATNAAWSTNDPATALANATPYLQGFGHVVASWLLLDLALTANRSNHPEAAGALAATRYFFAYELPKVPAWLGVVADRQLLCHDLSVEVL
jgi:alkylation response protein AidB-like acyl-CoA dehydrogenase